MSIRLEGQIKLLTYADSTATNNPKQRIFDYLQPLTNSSLSEFQSKQIIVEDGSTDLDIGFDLTEASYFFLITDQTISIKLNAGTEAIEITEFLFMRGPVTALKITNSSGSNANVTIAFGY